MLIDNENNAKRAKKNCKSQRKFCKKLYQQ